MKTKKATRAQFLGYFPRLSRPKRSQLKIQQMAFMILAVFFFFILVGLLFLSWQSRGIKENFEQLQKEQAISSLSVISDMPELNCGSRESLCIDEDKIHVMSNSSQYEKLWPVESVKIYKIYPVLETFVVYDSGQKNTKEYSTYVSICKKMKEFGSVYDKCEIGKLVTGVEVLENED